MRTEFPLREYSAYLNRNLALIDMRKLGHYGFASEAVFTMVQWLFLQSLESVTAVIDTHNGDSVRLVRRLGFRQAGLVYDAEFFKGHASHEYTFACRAEDLVDPRPLGER